MKTKHEITVTEKIAFIEERECIGCTKCIRVCPVDAILGAAKQMHSIISNECIGCELCLTSCPVNCITMLPSPKLNELERQQKIIQAHQRFDFRKFRLQRASSEKTKRQGTIQARKAAIHAAFLRVQAKNAVPVKTGIQKNYKEATN